LNLSVEKLVDSAMDRYDVPEWARPYAHRYVRENPISAVKFAISLVDIKRRKGEVTKTEVRLPNGKSFKIESILKLLNLFFYGEDCIAEMENAWAARSLNRSAEYEGHFAEMADMDSKYARAIKNLTEGLRRSVGEKPESISCAFDYISKLEPWEERIIATGIILRYSYAKTFGAVFYKVFYPVSPEFMRSFGKAFGNKNMERWDSEEAAALIRGNSISNDHLLELARESLARILFTIESNMKLAKELGMEKEVRLLADISIAYPFHRFSELGVDVDIEKEVKAVKVLSSKLGRD
jgi:hypothetical protein